LNNARGDTGKERLTAEVTAAIVSLDEVLHASDDCWAQKTR